MNRALFIVNYLEVLEHVFLAYLSEWREKAESAPSSLERNVFKLENNSCALRLIQLQEQTALHRNLRLHYPNALLLWNLSGIHRKMTYLLCSVWGLSCHSRAISDAICDPLTQVTPHRRARIDKVVIIQIGHSGVRIPVFPVAMNLINVLTKPAKDTLKIRTQIDSGVVSDDEGLIPASWH